jgi:hypothetical protein
MAALVGFGFFFIGARRFGIVFSPAFSGHFLGGY